MILSSMTVLDPIFILLTVKPLVEFFESNIKSPLRSSTRGAAQIEDNS